MQPCLAHCIDPAEPRESFDEPALLQRLLTRGPGSESARSRLVVSHRAALYRRCLRRLDNVQDAEDALQETMLRALQAIQGFEGRSSLQTWLFAIADNECNSLIRRRQRHHYPEHLRCMILIHEESRRGSFSEDGEQRRRVHETLSDLPPPAREVLSLRFFREASLAEIARTLDVSLSAAKMRLYRALDMFATRYPDGRSAGGSVRERLPASS